MATATPLTSAETARVEDYFFFEDAGWELYDRIDAWAGDRSGFRLVYLDGDLEVMAKSRHHDFMTFRLHELVTALANASGVVWEDAGAATFRERALDAGTQGDQTYYFGENAARMTGVKKIEPGEHPVPDLAIEIQIANPVKHALGAWSRLGVREVWHLNASGLELKLVVLRLRDDGSGYDPTSRSDYLPISDVQLLELLKLLSSEGAQDWGLQLPRRLAEILGQAG